MTNYTDTLMWKEINETPKVFSGIIANNDTVINNIVEEIKKRKITNIYAVARGTSDHALIYFKYAVEIMCGIPVALGASSIVTLYNGAINLKDSLVIGCSQSGKAVDVLEILKKANSQNGLTVTVTNDINSPMAKEANYHIYCGAGEEKSVAATKTFNAQLFALLLLASKMSGNSNLESNLKLLDKKTKKDMPKLDLITDKYAPKYQSMKSGFVLSRGVTYAIALEATLKLQETSYIQMKGYATSDFFHGPMAMVNETTPVLIYAPRYNFTDKTLADNFFNDEIKGIDKMLSLKAPVLLITDDKKLNDKYSEICDTALLPESENEFFSMFNFALFAQMFACKVSCGIGNNPDSPRALNKVTITK
jgi:glucosamine--fructose-6-phosphate aminotransferase (isomerizing)